MAASINDHFCGASNGSRPVLTTLSALKTIGATSISCDSLTGWPTGTAVHFILYTTDAQGNKVSGSQTDWKGVVSSNTITNIALRAGTDAEYAIGGIVECAPTAAWSDDLAEGLQVSHNQDGTLKDAAVASGIGTKTITGTQIATYRYERMENTTASIVTDGIVKSGWGYIANNTGANNISKTVTFPVTDGAFVNKPDVTVTFGGDHPTSTTYGDGDNNISGAVCIKATTITKDGFKVYMHTASGTNFAAGNSFFQWTARGN